MKNYHLASWYIWWQLLCEPARPARSRFNQCFNCLCFLAVIFDFVWLFPPLPFPLLFIFIPLSKVCSLSSYNLSLFLSVRMLRTLLFYASQLTFAYIDQVFFLSMIFQNIKNWPDPTYYLPISFRGIAMIVTHQFAWLIQSPKLPAALNRNLLINRYPSCTLRLFGQLPGLPYLFL